MVLKGNCLYPAAAVPRSIFGVVLSLRLAQIWPLVAPGEALELPRGSCAGVPRRWNSCMLHWLSRSVSQPEIITVFLRWWRFYLPAASPATSPAFLPGWGKTRLWNVGFSQPRGFLEGPGAFTGCSDGLKWGSSSALGTRQGVALWNFVKLAAGFWAGMNSAPSRGCLWGQWD